MVKVTNILVIAVFLLVGFIEAKKKPVGSLYSLEPKPDFDPAITLSPPPEITNVASGFKVRPTIKVDECKQACTNARWFASVFTSRTCQRRLDQSERKRKQLASDVRCARLLLSLISDLLGAQENENSNGFKLSLEMDALTRARFSRVTSEALLGRSQSLCQSLKILENSFSRGVLSSLPLTLNQQHQFDLDHPHRIFRAIVDSTLFQLSCMALFVVILRLCARQLWSPMTIAGILMGCFVISIAFNCLRQYNERRIESEAAMARYMQEPCHSFYDREATKQKDNPVEASYWRIIGSKILPGLVSPTPPISIEPDACSQLRKLAKTNPLLLVDPWEAVVMTFSKTMLTPIKLLFDNIATAVSERGWILGSGCIFLLTGVFWCLRPHISTFRSFMPRLPDPSLTAVHHTTPNGNALEGSGSTATTPSKSASTGQLTRLPLSDNSPSTLNTVPLPLPALPSPSPDRRRDLKKKRHRALMAPHVEDTENLPINVNRLKLLGSDSRRLSM